MVGHHLLPNIGPDRLASLSRPVLDLLRDECGFQGFYITDALNMMGVVLKYGNYKTTPMAVEAGCDIPLSRGIPPQKERGCLIKNSITSVEKRESRAKILEIANS